MSTTRHLVNRRRRLITTTPPRTAAPAAIRKSAPEPAASSPDPAEASPDPAEASPDPAEASPTPHSRLHGLRGRRLPLALAAATVLLGAFGAWAASEAAALREAPALRNTALTDIGRTSEVTGQIGKAVSALFSYDHAAPAADRAVRDHLTGRAVEQHRAMLAPVRAQAPGQKLVLTTTVTHTGVELIDGDRARVLVYADQRNTRTAAAEKGTKGAKDKTAAGGDTTYGAAMLAVEAVRKDGVWRISAIDTLGAGS
ncbi:hypothetical protein [Streptomyces sp. NPDC047097]|uniref:hypothetical protein n=1 Tax=Streptomyces sp. NPDC047097 TaxID=3155260 RepID=UPI0033EA3FDE